jgi:hypothetical protein
LWGAVAGADVGAPVRDGRGGEPHAATTNSIANAANQGLTKRSLG